MNYYADTHPAEMGVAPDGYVVVQAGGGWKKLSNAMRPPLGRGLILALRYQDREKIDRYHDYTRWRDMPPEYTDDATICTAKNASGDIGITVRASMGDNIFL